MILVENNFCIIKQIGNKVIRIDKILKIEFEVKSYFNAIGQLIKL